ncbi:hypothetical protein NMY22_g19971 [Coprinellus aureogranulatus]|nr:hypothetical protein NMY22_g19971 [Coprinellus aureogranulatus]
MLLLDDDFEDCIREAVGDYNRYSDDSPLRRKADRYIAEYYSFRPARIPPSATSMNSADDQMLPSLQRTLYNLHRDLTIGVQHFNRLIVIPDTDCPMRDEGLYVAIATCRQDIEDMLDNARSIRKVYETCKQKVDAQEAVWHRYQEQTKLTEELEGVEERLRSLKPAGKNEKGKKAEKAGGASRGGEKKKLMGTKSKASNKKRKLQSDDEEDASDDDNEGSGRSTYVPLENMTAEEQEKWEEIGREQIAKARKKNDPNLISAKIRRFARECPWFLPELATTDRGLALICFVRSNGNIICRWHERLRGNEAAFDSVTGIEGSAFAKEISTKNKKAVAQPGHAHCGCSIEHILFDFYWWKTLKIKTTRPAPKTNLSSPIQPEHVYDNIPRRVRSMMVELFKTFGHLDLNELYVGDEPWGTPDHKVALLSRQVVGIEEKLRALGQHVVLRDGRIDVKPM